MKKNIILATALVALSTAAFAQIKVTDKFGNLKTVGGTEPWNLINSTTPATANTQDIYQAGSVAIGIDNTQSAFYDSFSTKGSLVVREKSPITTGNLNNGIPAIKLAQPQTTPNLWGTIESPESRRLRLASDNNDIGIDGVQITMKNNRTPNDATNINYAFPPGVTAPALSTGANTAAPYTTFRAYANGRIAINQMAEIDSSPNTLYPSEALDIVQGNARIRGLADGSDNAVFPRTVVAKTDGTLGYTDGEVRTTRFASGTTTTMTNSDEIILIGSATNDRIVLPPNPKKGQIIRFVSLAAENTIISTNATSTTASDGYIPNRNRSATSTGSSYTSNDYRNEIKARTVLELVYWENNFAGGSGWIQIGGDNQF